MHRNNDIPEVNNNNNLARRDVLNTVVGIILWLFVWFAREKAKGS